jgi:hypothetical protein
MSCLRKMKHPTKVHYLNRRSGFIRRSRSARGNHLTNTRMYPRYSTTITQQIQDTHSPQGRLNLTVS